MFDFTKEISLSSESQSMYQKLQIILYLTAFFVFIYLSYLIIFPQQYFSFSFINPSSRANFIPKPRLTDSSLPSHGRIKSEENLFFDIAIENSYSQANINFALDKQEKSPKTSLPLSVRKSFQAFMYKEGEPIGFKNGSLLKNENDYYLISKDQLRKFSSLETLLSLGYPQESFQEVSKDDLRYNLAGHDISTIDSYPDATLFQINDDYYIFEDQKLKKFVSDQAFSTNYNFIQAIKKNVDFLNKYPLLENLAGFQNGTLVSNDVSVFVISENNFFPIDEIKTFESKAYQWEDVLKIGEDEFSPYEKGDLFTINSPHPEGTIFKTQENSQYYMIKGQQKHSLPTEKIAMSWLKKNPILISENGLKTKINCNLERKIFPLNSYSCKIPLEQISDLLGIDYEFTLTPPEDIKIDSININYKKYVNLSNFKEFLSRILKTIKENYVAPKTV